MEQHPLKNLDKFYTNPLEASICCSFFFTVAKHAGVDLEKYVFIEPSAGIGHFYNNLPEDRRIGVDIDSPANFIEEADYLTWHPPQLVSDMRYGWQGDARYVVIGNPPFGKRGKLAVDFFNHSWYADFIAFVVPLSFRKYFIHKQLNEDYRLIATRPLPDDSFHLPNGKNYKINTEFQIWTRIDLPVELKDKREYSPPQISHPDFEMRQYNNTKQALKEFDEPFDFAVPSQGYQDYSRREITADACEKNKQWILFVAKSKEVYDKLNAIDFDKLAHTCATITPGFRKNDVVKHYISTHQ